MFTDEQLLDPQFDESAYMNYLLHTSSASSRSSAAEQTRLKRCMDVVMSRMKITFSEDSASLVGEVKATYTAQQEVEDVCRSTESLTRATNRLRTMIEEPFLNVQQRVQELENTSSVAEALEAVQRLLALCARLKHYQHQSSVAAGAAATAATASSSPSPSPSAAASGLSTAGEVARQAAPQELLRDARTLKEIERLLGEHSGADRASGGFDLREVDVVATQMKTMEQASTAIRGRVRELLSMQDVLQLGASGGDASKAAQDTAHYHLREDPVTRTAQRVGLALQCASILASLPRTVQQFMAERKRDVIKSIVRDLDPQRITEEVTARVQASTARVADAEANRLRLAATQEVLLAHIQQVLFAVVQQSQCVLLFWSALLSQEAMEGPASPSASAASPSLVHMVDNPAQLLADFWQTTMDKVREALESLQRRTELQVALVSNYPRYHRVLAYFTGSYCAALLTHWGTTATTHAAMAASAPASAPSLDHSTGGLVTRSSQLILQHLPQCGMGDVLLLLQVVERTCGRASASSRTLSMPPPTTRTTCTTAPAAMLGTVQRALHIWTREVTATLEQRFTQQVMEHHRQRLNAVLGGLQSVAPTSAAQATQAVDVRVVDLQHPSVPAAANALQAHQYTQLVLSDVQSYHHDSHTVCLLLRCATRCLSQLAETLKRTRAKWPLPPLPAIQSTATRAQVMHVCIANAATTLSFDITNALSILPAVAAVAGGRADAGALSPINAGRAGSARDSASATPSAGLDEDMDDDSALVALRGELWDLAGTFREMSESLSQPFMRSLHVTLGNSIAYCVQQAVVHPTAPASTAVGQLRDQLAHFAAHYFFLFDPRTSEWAGASRDVTDALVARLLAALTTAPPPSPSSSSPAGGSPPPAPVRACWQQCLRGTAEALLDGLQRMQNATVGGGVRSRSSLLLRGALQQVGALYAVGDWSTPGASAVLSGLLTTIAPLLARLMLVQQAALEAAALAGHAGLPFAPVSLAQRLSEKEERVADTLEQGLLTLYDTDDSATATRTASTGCSPSAATQLIPVALLETGLQAAFDEAVAYLASQPSVTVTGTLRTLWVTVGGTTGQ